MRELLANVAKLYSDSVKTFGTNARGAGWKDEASQILRFEKLLEIVEHSKRAELTINDLGCGYGAFYHYLIAHSRLKISKYYGYDISEQMLTLAQSAISDRNATLVNSEQILYEADYSFASGIFNVKLDIKNSLWEDYIKETLFNMSEKSRRGFSFNILTTHVDYEESHLYYADPFFYFDLCKRHFSPNVSLLQNYGLYEWTMIVRKE